MRTTNSAALAATLAMGCALVCALPAQAQSQTPIDPAAAKARAGAVASTRGQLIERGRYVVMIGGCNDCHTAGYGESNGTTPERERLTGSPLGWKGPWGTSIAVNLRLYFQQFKGPGDWVKAARTLRTEPPMPWFTVNKMSDGDLRAIYAYVVSLGPAGEPMPKHLPPGQNYAGPTVVFPAPPPAK